VYTVNKRKRKAVEPRKVGSHAVIAAAVCSLTLGLIGCVDIDGGALELSWSIRDFDGAARSCGDVDFDEVRLCWESVGDSVVTQECALRDATRHAVFPCLDAHGVTRFVVDPGPTAIWIEPLCGDGAVATDYVVPAAIVRDVSRGEIAILNALLVVADDASCVR
jgi:hypothetical protein